VYKTNGYVFTFIPLKVKEIIQVLVYINNKYRN